MCRSSSISADSRGAPGTEEVIWGLGTYSRFRADPGLYRNTAFRGIGVELRLPTSMIHVCYWFGTFRGARNRNPAENFDAQKTR
ncbi:hypothetical protein CVT26_015635 [Gymnopilus dilepis]|uniref:Uncharacterized protein n=1 Tax=Gymnopilus dilepis TaxID=231916 RepID=A0A409YDI4_9AGAR|nr:hypothetical protein CVT26_015635 [Gymnopilus dilepis]